MKFKISMSGIVIITIIVLAIGNVNKVNSIGTKWYIDQESMKSIDNIVEMQIKSTEKMTEIKNLIESEDGMNAIVVNDVYEFKQGSFYPLRLNNYYNCTKDELFDYYCYKFDISDLFPGMIEENTDSYGVYKSNGGEDIQGHNFIWVDPIDDAKISIELLKNELPKADVCLKNNNVGILSSTILTHDVNIFYYEDERDYYAKFYHKNLGFSVFGHNLSKQDFICVLYYLISQ